MGETKWIRPKIQEKNKNKNKENKKENKENKENKTMKKRYIYLVHGF